MDEECVFPRKRVLHLALSTLWTSSSPVRRLSEFPVDYRMVYIYRQEGGCPVVPGHPPVPFGVKAWNKKVKRRQPEVRMPRKDQAHLFRFFPSSSLPVKEGSRLLDT